MDPLADRELASGKAKPIKAPEKLIAAAVLDMESLDMEEKKDEKLS